MAPSRWMSGTIAVIVLATTGVTWLAADLSVRYRQRQRQAVLALQMRSVTLAAVLYAQDHGDRLPPAEHWKTALQPYLMVPLAPLPPPLSGSPRQIVMNRAASGMRLGDFESPSNAILFFESTSTRADAADSLSTLPPANSGGPMYLGHADGHWEDYYPTTLRDEILRQNQEALPRRVAAVGRK